jgi:phospholipase C
MGRPRTRRRLVRDGVGLAAGASLAGVPGLRSALAAGHGLRRPGSLPDPGRPAGTPDAQLPFDHVVVLMMENHSFDNYFGMLSRHGQPRADGFVRFGKHGRPLDRQPYHGGYVVPVRAPSMCQPEGVTQSWRATHEQINGGRMNGFPETDTGSMFYWDETQLPFYYSLASTFTLANRWFCSAPCQTFPNRRFLLAGTANGLISTDTTSVFDPPPATGTIFDRFNRYGVSWRNYYSDLPQTAIISSIVRDNLANVVPVAGFFADCAAGTLPAVSFVDPEFGALSDVVGGLSAATNSIPSLAHLGSQVSAEGGDEENPQNIEHGETFSAQVVDAVLQSPAWRRTLLVWTYDEHGGYYDHVPPPRAVAPDAVKPRLGPHDPPGGYGRLGPRVPTVVVSPYARRRRVTNVVHDHTSIYQTIAAKWNLPACTYRDANATTLLDFLDTRKPAFPEPPVLAAPGDLAASETSCDTGAPDLVVRYPRRRHRRKHHHARS